MNAFFLLQNPTAIPDPQVNFPLLMPELIIGGVAVLVMLVDTFAKPQQRWTTGGISLAGLATAAVVCLWMWTNGETYPSTAYNGMIVFDELRLSFSLIAIFVSALTVLISIFWTDNENLPSGEFHSLLLFATVGMVLMASAGDLVMIFLGLEILSISTYVMAGFRRTDLRSNESSLKYFILGSFSSAFLLYGIALIYGGTATKAGLAGTTNIAEIATRINASQFPALLFAGAAMMLIGFGFKIATAPFHVWTPDVYEGAPTPVTAFMAAGPKAAGFAAFLRVFVLGFPLMAVASDTLQFKLNLTWTSLLAILAAVTMTVGNVAAIVQNNVKRMLAYSSIAHAGYALAGFLGAGAATTVSQRNDAISSVAFYLLVYSIMNLGAFAIVTLLAEKGDRRTEFDDYAGIGFKAPALAFTLSIFMFSMLGLPPTAGFMGKLYAFQAAFKAGFAWIVVIGVINSAVSAYYYLRLIIVMFFRERETEWEAPEVPGVIYTVILIAIIGVIALGILPGPIMDSLKKSPTEPVTSVKASK
jgi:NADH-quinone oxidoreductase subunit N